MTTGQIFAVVGPSGAGKDSLIAGAMAKRPDLVWARRVITRLPEAAGEPFEAVTAAQFARRKAHGEFILDWQAHDLCYGIPMSICADLASGRSVIFNGSRVALPDAFAKFPNLTVLLVTASPPVLAQRLSQRGRESSVDIAQRLSRADFAMPAGITARVVTNDGSLEQGVAQFLAALQPVRA